MTSFVARSEEVHALWKPRPQTQPKATLAGEPLVCFTHKEAKEIDSKLIDLQTRLDAYKLSVPRRLGWSLGCGALAGPEFNGGQTGVTAVAGCGAIWGWRFK